MKRIANLFTCKLVLIIAAIYPSEMPAAEVVTLRAREVAAANLAMIHFRRLNPRVDMKHYDVELTRHRDELQVAFIADDPESSPPPHARTGGGTIYGPDMTYLVSISKLRIIRYNFQR
jgi:hypothetical protein